MNFLRKPLVRTLCLWAGWRRCRGRLAPRICSPRVFATSRRAPLVSETWPRLRSYAQSQTDPEWSGWAYFLAGYQEYEGQRYSEAAQDLAQAAQSGFSLADYAVFYQASALQPVQPAAGRRRGASGFRRALSPKPLAL